MEGNPTFFSDQQLFRQWLEKHHESHEELWVGFYKKETGIPSITWSESVDQALCFGWIDGLRKKHDEKSYKIRFTPRKPRSHWSNVNIKKIDELIEQGLVHQAGLDAYAKRDIKNSGKASFEQKNVILSKDYSNLFQQNEIAWKNFSAMPPGYRKQCIWYIIQAKREETRLRRLNIVMDHSSRNEKIPPLRRPGE